MKAQVPAEGVMLVKDYSDISSPSKNYRIDCDCGDPDHSVSMWIEVDSENDARDIQIGFYADTWTPWWGKYYNRFKCIWKLLTTGVVHYEHHMVLSKQAATNFATVILNDVKQLETNQKRKPNPPPKKF